MTAGDSLQAALGPLVRALSYAARDGFAPLSTLAGLEPLVRRVADEATRAGAPPSLVHALREQALGVDTLPAPERRERVVELARVLSAAVALPDPLRALAAGATAEGQEPPLRPRPTAGKLEPHPSSAGDDEDEGLPVSFGPLRARHSAGPTTSLPRRGRLADPLSLVTPVRGRLAGELKRRGIGRAVDVLEFLPRAYEDRRQILPLSTWPEGQWGAAVARVRSVSEVGTGPGRRLRVVFADDSGSVDATFFHFRKWMRDRFEIGESYLLTGRLNRWGARREIVHPEIERLKDLRGDPANFGRIVPVYPGLSRSAQRGMRSLALKVVERYAPLIEDPVPPEVLARQGLPGLGEALREIHFPSGPGFSELLQGRAPAQRRLVFDELFLLQLGLALRRAGLRAQPGIAFEVTEARLEAAVARLPFSPTASQRRVLREIAADMARPEPMNRLLLGDVGSGKTAVAAVAALLAAENGYQTALMAPTEILAQQHHRTVAPLLKAAGFRAALLTSGLSRSARNEAREQALSGEASLLVGTHALLEEEVLFHKLGLVVVDEQHRFGVMQRAALMAKGQRPDVLVMTATPIPRTLCMALYGDLDVSVIDELPPGRTPVVTRIFAEGQRERVFALLERELRKGRQAFVVYPLVEESEALDLASATEGARRLASRFPQYATGLVHGRMKPSEKDEVMRRFREGAIRLLVSTTVVEVGVDVPNATVMVVEAAERFGLAQLHQLRGRVGRGAERSYCLLVVSGLRAGLLGERLAILARTQDGARIAQADLELRGPGDYLGTRQSGAPGLALADLGRDQALLSAAQQEAFRLAQADPTLAAPEHGPLRAALIQRWEGRLGLAEVG